MLFKYPRTPHLNWSPGATDDDVVVRSVDHFHGRQVVVTEKMDGENTSLYRDHFHSRSLDSSHHASQQWAKNFWGAMRSEIPEGWRVCGENLYAQHSLHYSALDSFFLGFSVWDDQNSCLSWDDTVEWFALLGVKSVPVLYEGIFDQKIIQEFWKPSLDGVREGYVVRTRDSFSYEQFAGNVAKFVRPNHVRSSTHWRHATVVPNCMRQIGNEV